MTSVQSYLTEEVVEDYADGLIDRREALRRLGLLGLAAASAGAVLAACSREGSGTGPPSPSSSASASVPAGPTPLPTQAITFPGLAGRTLLGAYAQASAPKGAVLVIHENRGLTDHIRSVAGRLAASGYSALAVDLLSAEGGTARFTDSAQATAALNAAPPGRFIEDMRSGIDELARREPGRKLGAVGFCFGGAMVWALLAAGEPRLAAAVPFYGPTPDSPDFSGSGSAAVLAIYAERDTRVNATRDLAATALAKAGLTHEIVTFPGVEHAFFNDTGPRYNAAAATAAYQRVLDWYGLHLASQS
jgi:carboxymethylenebutenolidase